MKTTKHNFFFAWNHENEEAWLNEMSARGKQLTALGLCRYEFEDGEPNEYSYRLELLEWLPSHPSSAEYIRFLQDTGVEYIGSFMRWAYFRRKKSEGAFDLFSDITSRISHYNRIRTLFTIGGFANIPLFISNFHNVLYSDLIFLYVISFLQASVISLLLYGAVKTTSKINKLKKEKMLRE